MKAYHIVKPNKKVRRRTRKSSPREPDWSREALIYSTDLILEKCGLSGPREVRQIIKAELEKQFWKKIVK